VVFLFEIVVSDSSGGLEPTFEIIGVIGLLNDYLLINILPFFHYTLSLVFVVDIQPFV